MLRKALDYIKLNNMIEKGDRIVIGVSGGADSVCLLYVLEEYCRSQEAVLIAVHVNHNIRGEEAARDEQFVKDLCSRMNVDYRSFSADVKGIAKEQGLSEEEAGRKVRYEAFFEICRKDKCNKIAIAHNKNDNAETVLFHLFRGTGLRGLTGIEPKRCNDTEAGRITLIRPLLCIERKEIEDFLHGKGIDYQNDSTNNTEAYSRNKIRNRILKYAAGEINSGVIGNIAETALQVKEAQEYIDANVARRYESLVIKDKDIYSIPAAAFLEEPPVIQKGILLRIIKQLAGKLKDIEAKHVEAARALFTKPVGRRINLPYQMVAEREYEVVRFFCEIQSDNPAFEEPMEPMQVSIPGLTCVVMKKLAFEAYLMPYKNNQTIPKSSCVKWFDYDKIENAVEIRTRREGDYIQINSHGGNKKLKDYLIDRKIPRKQRDAQLLIADGSHVMWILDAGDRISERYKISDSTTRILVMNKLDVED